MTTPIPTVSPHLSGDIPFDEIVQGIKDLTIYAKQYREQLEELEEHLEEKQIALEPMQTTRTPQKTQDQTIHGDIQAAALRVSGGVKTFHFYWTGNMNDAELVHLFIEFPERVAPNVGPSMTHIKEGSWTFEHNTFYSLSKQEARRIWDALISWGFECENGVRQLGVTTLIKP